MKYKTIDDINSNKPNGSKLTALSFAEPRGKAKTRSVLCLCECGKYKTTIINSFISGVTTHCGCVTNLTRFRTHGLSDKHPLYSVWVSMRARCRYENSTNFHRYGGRGISVYPEWDKDFMSFYSWAINKWSKGLDLDRIDNDGNYEPNNCRFVTTTINCRNKTDTIFIEYNGKRMTAKEWAEELGIKYATIWNRYSKGWAVEKILYTKKYYNINYKNNLKQYRG